MTKQADKVNTGRVKRWPVFLSVFFLLVSFSVSGVLAAPPDALFCDPGKTKIDTAIGCIPASSAVLVMEFLLKWIMGLAGGVILILLIITSYNLLTSQGNPEKLQAVKENYTSILAGFILIVFSLLLLNAIGANILGLPTF